MNNVFLISLGKSGDVVEGSGVSELVLANVSLLFCVVRVDCGHHKLLVIELFDQF
jgi:hypothetical protein